MRNKLTNTLFVAAGLVLAFSTGSLAGIPIPETNTFAREFTILTNAGECLEVEKRSSQIAIARCDGSAAQKFEIDVSFTDASQIQVKTMAGKCVEITYADRNLDGAIAAEGTCASSLLQYLRIVGKGISALPAPNSAKVTTTTLEIAYVGKCYDDRDRRFLRQQPCDGSSNQSFQIKNAQQISADDAEWNRIEKSTDVNDFKSYLSSFGLRANHAADANKRIADLTAPVSPDDAEWNRIEKSTNVTDFRAYLRSFGSRANHAADANKRIADLTAPVSPDDAEWNRIEKSTNVADFRAYLRAFGSRANHAADANKRIADLTAPVSPDDAEWKRIENSSNVADFRAYLRLFGVRANHSTEANQKIVDLTAPLSPDDREWKRIENSSNVADFRAYLRLFGARANHATVANQKIVDLTNVVNPLTLDEDGHWNAIEKSTNRKDFDDYLKRFGTSGKYARLARLKISLLPTAATPTSTGSVEDLYWDNIKSKTDAKFFQDYLRDFPGGKYKVLAEQKIRMDPNSGVQDENHWNRIKSGTNVADFRTYMTTFPRGAHVKEAGQKIVELEQQSEIDEFKRSAEFGSLSEIGGLTKVFINASDFNSRSRIVSELRKRVPSLNIVGSRSNADFFVEYKLVKTMVCDPGPNPPADACELHTGTLWLHTVKLRSGNQVNRILWTTTKSKSYSETGMNLFTSNPAAQAGESLAKDMKNAGF